MTFRQALEQIPDKEVRASAMVNCSLYNDIDNEVVEGYDTNLWDVLVCAFPFFHTPEGFDYWRNLYKEYKEIKLLK